MPGVDPGSLVAVTGASGFIGSHIVGALLRKGYKVRAVVRDPSDEAKVAHLRALAADAGAEGALEFAAGDLLQAGSYDAAFVGCAGIVHSAAVVDIGGLAHADAMQRVVAPAVKGTENVFASVTKAASVRRVVHTSTIAAIIDCGGALDRTFTEDDWNKYSAPANGDYYGYGKTLAERAAWRAAGVGDGAAEKPAWDLATVNPGVVLGPCLTKAHTKASPVVVRQFIYGNEQPNYRTSFVDVRDVAAAHVEALCRPQAGGQRFICVQGDTILVNSLAERAKRLFPDLRMEGNEPGAAKMWGAWFLSFLPVVGNKFMTSYQCKMLEQTFRYDNTRSRAELGVSYRSLDDTVRDTVDSMVGGDVWVKPRRK